MRKLLPVIQFSHMIVASKLEFGGHAIDATAGNGNDTLFLINHISKKSKLFVFDIQEDAIKRTKKKLIDNLSQADFNKINQRLHFYCAGHQDMDLYVKENVKAIMFNLGYLPESQSQVITKPYTTLKAIEKGLSLLVTQGIMSIVLYPGHEGGEEEAQLVTNYLSRLSSYEYEVIRYDHLNKSKSPYLIIVEKKR